jgi:hypothetical protein
VAPGVQSSSAIHLVDICLPKFCLQCNVHVALETERFPLGCVRQDVCACQKRVASAGRIYLYMHALYSELTFWSLPVEDKLQVFALYKLVHAVDLFLEAIPASKLRSIGSNACIHACLIGTSEL